MSAPVIVNDMFACIIPGRPMTTAFTAIDNKKLMLPIPAPAHIKEFTLALLKPSLPQDHAVAVFYSLPPFQEWQYIGQLSLQSPSAIFRAPWIGQLPDNLPGLQLGLSVESLNLLQSLSAKNEQKDEKEAMDSAQGIAQDLFRFMGSFSQSTGQYANLGNVLVIPTNCINTWFDKFQAKHKREPYFWLKKKD